MELQFQAIWHVIYQDEDKAWYGIEQEGMTYEKAADVFSEQVAQRGSSKVRMMIRVFMQSEVTSRIHFAWEERFGIEAKEASK